MKRIIVAIIAVLVFAGLLALPNGTRAAERPVGKLRWKFKTGYRTYLAAAGGVIYAASPTGCTDYVPCGPPARLLALDARTGREKWKLEDVGDDSAPLIADGMVYQAGGSLYAVNALSGELVWSFKRTTGTVMHSSAIAEGTIFFWEVISAMPLGVFGGTLHAVEIKTRKEKWKFSIDHGVVYGPVVSGGMIYFGTTPDSQMSKGSLCALDARTGKIIWEFGVAGPSPAVRSGVVYHAGQDGSVYALDARTGRKVWQFNSEGGFGSPYVVADRLIHFAPYGPQESHLHAVDPTSGRQKWEFRTDRGVYASPAIADGVIYVGSLDKHLHAVDARKGREIWKFNMGGYVESSPVVASGVVYVASSDGYIYAVK